MRVDKLCLARVLLAFRNLLYFDGSALRRVQIRDPLHGTTLTKPAKASEGFFRFASVINITNWKLKWYFIPTSYTLRARDFACQNEKRS